jgi:hypothetical protein
MSVSGLVLLLSLAPIVFASDDKTDRATLKGVTSVCVVVEGKADAQAAIEEKLTDAGIPVDKKATTCLYLNVRTLQAVGRQGIAKRERPIPLYAVDVRLEFLQTVILSRDKTIKTYAPTWSSSNMATVSADELAKTVVELATGLTDQFVIAYKSVN